MILALIDQKARIVEPQSNMSRWLIDSPKNAVKMAANGETLHLCREWSHQGFSDG